MMDNPEDVLQALDEFQKMKPSEIPKVLEEYLMWVAKTGEPVYQWSLIKTLFREKLLRVMTEFYESCNPTLLGPPPPNVEPFNYEIMKSNLLERLENFANPPFTVQRICELLIAPRREYNRIDKYMRAVEKNILVVSTKEPGAFGRRSENGDSLVNGSVEDETSHHGQSSNDVDMENWVKDCTNAAPAAIPSGASDDMAIDSELKSSYEKQERIKQMYAIDVTASNFVTAASDFQVETTMPPQIPVQEVSAVVQNLATIGGEAPALADVDAIMNEDTSSQPSLDLESDDTDSNDSKKLQTTFQAKDFKLDDSKSSDSESQDSKSEDRVDDNAECNKESELIQLAYTDQKPVSERAEEIGEAGKLDVLGAVASESEQITDKIDLQVSEKSEVDSNECIASFQLESHNLEVKQNDTEENANISRATTEESIDSAKVLPEEKEESKTESVIQENIQELTDANKGSFDKVESAPCEASKPIVEEPTTEATDSSNSTKPETTDLTIQETAEDDLKAKTIVPDPIPIVEEPKETEQEVKQSENIESVVDELIEPKSVITTNVNNGLEESPSADPEQKEDIKSVLTSCENAIVGKEAVESMDVDNDGSASNLASQDEPMEQDTTEAMNS